MQFYTFMLFGISAILINRHNFGEALIGVNVKPADRTEYRFLVSIMDAQDYSAKPAIDHICTGAFITKEHVLTAGHCLVGRLVNQTSVVAGSNNLIHGFMYKIKWWVNYTQWSGEQQEESHYRVNDIAVLRIRGRITPLIEVGILSPMSSRDIYDTDAVVAGWGKTTDNLFSFDLLKADLRILSKANCIQRVSKLCGTEVRLDHRFLCTAADPFVLLNYGDSGAPLIWRNMIQGVSKSTTPLSHVPFHPEKVNLHTDIDHYRDFISAVTAYSFEWT